MKTSRFSENYDLCHPLVGCENSNNNSKTVASSNGHPSGVVAYGKSSKEQTSNFEKNANELQLKQQQQQEQNKKRKRETGEYCFEKNSCTFFRVSSSCPLHIVL